MSTKNLHTVLRKPTFPEDIPLAGEKDSEEVTIIAGEEDLLELKKEEPVPPIEKAEIINLDKIVYYSNLFIAVHPFILTGYRIHHNLQECITSIFKLHNETFNIWSHMIACLSFVIIFILIITDTELKSRNSNGVIFLYIFSSITCFVCSSVYHTYNCHSMEVAHCVFKIDLFGILFQLLAGTICSQHFMFYESDMVRKTYIGLFVGLCILTLIIVNVDFFKHEKANIIRIILISSLFCIAFGSCIHWTAIARIDEVTALTPYLLLGYAFMFLGFIFYFSKFPECVFQYRFVDLYLQSHTIWHLCVFACAICYFLLQYKYNELILQGQLVNA
jgi:adiponectin receptor